MIKSFVFYILFFSCSILWGVEAWAAPSLRFTLGSMSWGELLTTHTRIDGGRARGYHFSPKVYGLERPYQAYLAQAQKLTQKKDFEKGILGKNGHSLVYVGPLSEYKESHHLYWVMVKVLSKRYGCFMTKKHTKGDIVIFKCKDSRLVAFQKSQGENWIQFQSKQFDPRGHEIVVENGHITETILNPYIAKAP